MELKGFQRSYLMKEAHSIKPTIQIGKNGFTSSIVSAVKESLDFHELIKVKFVDFKEERRKIAAELAEKTNSTLVKVIGNIAVLYKAKDNTEERKYHIPGIHLADG